MAIQLNRTHRNAPPLRNTHERRLDLTDVIIRNMNSAAERDSFASHRVAIESYEAAAPINTFDASPALTFDVAAPGAADAVEENMAASAGDESRPEPGVWRTERGTIKLVVHPTGTFIKPHYNYSGILLSVELDDGSRFVRAGGCAPWTVQAADGSPISELEITSLTLDRSGSLIYQTSDRVRTVIRYDGQIQTAKLS
ncbi:MAG TPA: hypothetical protein V6C81_05865 [Planktothrix sp.]|jgi:hypothetical protein